MIVVDYILLGVIALSVVVGVFRGFFREALSLATWIVAVWVAWQYSGVAEPLLEELLSEPTVRLWVVRFGLFALILILGALINHLVAMAVQRTGLTGTDRVLGMVFGLGRGVVIVGVLLVFADLLQLPREPWWKESLLIPYGQLISAWMSDFVAVGPDPVLGQAG